MESKDERIMRERGERPVFVYGTLRAGGRNDIARLAPAARLLGASRVRGRLHTTGPYPGLRLGGDDADWVVGEVYAVTPADERVLDALEGIGDEQPEYVRREVELEVDGRMLECLLYEYDERRAETLPRIKGGDWIAFHREDQSSG